MSAQEADVPRPGAAAEQDLDVEETTDRTETEEPEEEGVEELSLDVVFEILKNERRRSVLEYLDGNEERVVLGELAEHIAARENDTTVESLTAQQRKRVYVGLYQCHLPKMDDAGIVEFDRNRGIVELAANASQLEEYLETSPEADHDWPMYYLGIALAGGVLFAGGVAGLYPAVWVANLVMGGVLAAFAGCAIFHHQLTRVN